MILTKAKNAYSRKSVSEDNTKMYVFTDNGDRTSGKGKIPDDSEYSTRFGKKNLCYPSMTSAVLRGLSNSYPITTQKRYVSGAKSYEGNWNDEDFEEFKKVIDDDFEHIKKACIEKGYTEVVFPSKGILNGAISRLTFSRTPKLYNYIIEKELELKKFEP